jgi:glycosyltransferase involved in cell wall biosynthesis
MFSNQATSLYAAFDIFPSAKGAATHINHFLMAHQDFFGEKGTWLHCLADEGYPLWQQENHLTITRFVPSQSNFLSRTGEYSQYLAYLLSKNTNLKLAHFRDIWSGLPLLSSSVNAYKLFEVNSLPSIELPFRYALPKQTIAKLQGLEKMCLTESQHIVVPSWVLQNFLVANGVNQSKITVIPNGADIPPIFPRPVASPTNYIMYFGALQTWQGIGVLLKAFSQLADIADLQLVIASSVKEKFTKNLQKLAEKLQLKDKIIWLYQLDKANLAAWLQSALLTIAPLTECSRNLQQGCCPLKIIESMACGVPVVASDMPVTRELIEHRQDGYLVRADRPMELARAIRILVEEPAWRVALGKAAKAKIAGNFTWDLQQKRLQELFAKQIG